MRNTIRSARCMRCSSTRRARIHRRIRGSADRCGQRDLDRDRERGARDPGAAAQPDERMRSSRPTRRARRIAVTIYDEIRTSWGRRFPDTLGDDALDVLVTPVRTMRRALLRSAPHGSTARRDRARDIRADEGRREAPADRLLMARARQLKPGSCAAQCQRVSRGARHARRRRETLQRPSASG